MAATFFFALKRSRITSELRSGVLLSTTFGFSISSFFIGMFEPAKFLIKLDNEVNWSKDSEILHTVYLLLGFVFLVLTAIIGYFIARKNTTEEPK